MGGIYEEPLMQRYIDMGARFILSGADLSFLSASAVTRSRFLRTMEAAEPEPAACCRF